MKILLPVLLISIVSCSKGGGSKSSQVPSAVVIAHKTDPFDGVILQHPVKKVLPTGTGSSGSGDSSSGNGSSHSGSDSSVNKCSLVQADGQSYCSSFLSSVKMCYPDQTVNILTINEQIISCLGLDPVVINAGLTSSNSPEIYAELNLLLQENESIKTSSLGMSIEQSALTSVTSFTTTGNKAMTIDELISLRKISYFGKDLQLNISAENVSSKIENSILANGSDLPAISAFLKNILLKLDQTAYNNSFKLNVLAKLSLINSTDSFKQISYVVDEIARVFVQTAPDYKSQFLSIFSNSLTEELLVQNIKDFRTVYSNDVGLVYLTLYHPSFVNGVTTNLNLSSPISFDGMCYPNKGDVTITLTNLFDKNGDAKTVTKTGPCVTETASFSISPDLSDVIPETNLYVGLYQTHAPGTNPRNYSATATKENKITINSYVQNAVSLDGFGDFYISGTCDGTLKTSDFSIQLVSEGKTLQPYPLVDLQLDHNAEYNPEANIICGSIGTFSVKTNLKSYLDFAEASLDTHWLRGSENQRTFDIYAYTNGNASYISKKQTVTISKWVDGWQGSLVKIATPKLPASAVYDPNESPYIVNISGDCDYFNVNSLNFFLKVKIDELDSSPQPVTCGSDFKFTKDMYVGDNTGDHVIFYSAYYTSYDENGSETETFFQEEASITGHFPVTMKFISPSSETYALPENALALDSSQKITATVTCDSYRPKTNARIRIRAYSQDMVESFVAASVCVNGTSTTEIDLSSLNYYNTNFIYLSFVDKADGSESDNEDAYSNIYVKFPTTVIGLLGQ